MKIAIVVNGFPENSETFIINKVLALANAGNKVVVVRLNNSGNQSLVQLYNFNNNKNIEIVNPNLPANLFQLIGYFFQFPLLTIQSFSLKTKRFNEQLKRNYFLNLFNHHQFDIIHFEFSGLAVSFLDMLKDIQPATVLSCRGSAEKVKVLTEPNRAQYLQLAIDSITAVHCVSNDMKSTIAPYCKHQEKVFVNRPAIDASFFSPNKKDVDFNGVMVLSIGRFTFQKGYLIGILAIKKLIEKGFPIQWNIIGDGPQMEEMIFHIHELQLQEHIILHGKKNKNEVSDWMNKSDIFLLTSVYEGIPNVVLEAMAMELPVVTTKSGGVDEVIEHGVDGFIAPLYNIDAISSLLEQFINDKQLANSMGKAARKKVLASYTLERQLTVFQEAYHKIIQSASK
ncbi:MAG: glycosyltransferase family 4 protein [Chitinophagaceae bacterium]|jgi:colanic acid/amylovoran biosynthesis glycosyltransferase|nr:glycosyltransferase family 4 protein [Chitinophagaceae bacterium]